MDKQIEDEIVRTLAEEFASFGGGQTLDSGNPLDVMLKDCEPQFAMGVDIRAVVKRTHDLYFSLRYTTSV